MRKSIVSYLAFVVVGFVSMAAALLLTAAPVSAIEGGLTISPTAVDRSVDPGGEFSSEILVANQGQVDYAYKVYATPYSVSGEEYKPYFSPVAGAPDITTWFSFAQTSGNLKTGNQNTVPFRVKVPAGTPAGGYYATVFVETEDKGANGVITRKRVGAIIYLKVSGPVTEKGSVDTWHVPFMQRDPLTATLKLANTGSVHYNSKVKVTVSDIFGGPKLVFERQPNVLPQKVRRMVVEWKDGATFGLFKVGGQVEYLGKTEQLPTRYVFVASPLMRVLTIAVFVLLIAGLTYVGVKRVARK
jgi:hypothetical protein